MSYTYEEIQLAKEAYRKANGIYPLTEYQLKKALALLFLSEDDSHKLGVDPDRIKPGTTFV